MLVLKISNFKDIASIKGFSMQFGGSIDFKTQSNSFKGSLRANSDDDVHSSEVLTRMSDIYETPKTKAKLHIIVQKLKENEFEPYKIYSEPISIQNNTRIKDFAHHVYEQMLKVFDAIKKKTTNDQIKHNVKSLKKRYKNEFNEFIKGTMRQKLRTNLGVKKVVLNIVDTSHLMLKRFLNHLLLDVEDNAAREGTDYPNSIKKEIDLVKRLEYAHVCKKFNICRSVNSYSNYVVDFINKIVSCSNNKLSEAANALAQILKDLEHIFGVPINKLFDEEGVKNYYNNVDMLEKSDPPTLRFMFQLISNVIVNKNQPYVMMNTAALNRTIAFVELIDIIDEYTPANKEHIERWDDVLNELDSWSSDKRPDVIQILEVFVSDMFKDLKDYANPETRQKVLDIIKIIGHDLQDVKKVEEKKKSLEVFYEY